MAKSQTGPPPTENTRGEQLDRDVVVLMGNGGSGSEPREGALKTFVLPSLDVVAMFKAPSLGSDPDPPLPTSKEGKTNVKSKPNKVKSKVKSKSQFNKSSEKSSKK